MEKIGFIPEDYILSMIASTASDISTYASGLIQKNMLDERIDPVIYKQQRQNYIKFIMRAFFELHYIMENCDLDDGVDTYSIYGDVYNHMNDVFSTTKNSFKKLGLYHEVPEEKEEDKKSYTDTFKNVMASSGKEIIESAERIRKSMEDAFEFFIKSITNSQDQDK